MRGILLDIEGTTTPITFVYDVLFPYARRHAAAYVRKNDVSDLRREYEEDERAGHKPALWSDDPLPYIHWLMDQDRKSTALKRIQGEIWLDGYRGGELHGEVFGDVHRLSSIGTTTESISAFFHRAVFSRNVSSFQQRPPAT